MRPRGGPGKLAKARQMRKQPTEAENRVWRLVRGRQICGLKFRRQAIIAGFIADFYCAEMKLILELDGDCHDNPETKVYDGARDDELRKLGYQVVRIRNDMATSATIEKIVTSLIRD